MLLVEFDHLKMKIRYRPGENKTGWKTKTNKNINNPKEKLAG